jgi:hypothetical protein
MLLAKLQHRFIVHYDPRGVSRVFLRGPDGTDHPAGQETSFPRRKAP